MHMKRVKQSENEMTRQREEEEGKWFTPKLYAHHHPGNADRSSSGERGKTDEDRVEYLYKGDVLEREKRREEREKGLYGAEVGYTYQPHLDPLSMRLGRPSSVGELYKGGGGGGGVRGGKEEVKREVEEVMGEACTFTPQINAHSRKILEKGERRGRSREGRASGGYDEVYRQYYTHRGFASPSPSPSPTPNPTPRIINLQEPEKMMQDINAYLSRNEERRKKGEVERELKELGGCTFHPRLEAKFDRGDMDRPVVVPGLAR